jgi:uncharacterized protein (TIGR03437 family)
MSSWQRIVCILSLAAAGCAAQGGVWETRAAYPLEATEVSAAVIGAHVYVLGGLLRGGSTNRMFVYNTVSDLWDEAAPLPIPLGVDHANVAALNGKVYFLGGIRIGTPFVTGQTFEYDPATNAWTERAAMPTPRGAAGVAALEGKIYVAGGLDATRSLAAFDAYDPATNSWETLPAMPLARDHLTAQAVNGRFYAISGRNGGTLFRDVTEYNPATRTWTARAPIITGRGGIGSGVINGRIVVFGGEGNVASPNGTFPQNEEYNPATNAWRALAPMPTPRHGLYGAAVEGNRLFAPSGGPVQGASFSNTHEAFIAVPAQRPEINANGIVNAASFQPAVAAHTLTTLFGTGLAPGVQIASRLPLATQMNGVQVRVNGEPAELLYVGPTQINFLNKAATGGAVVVRYAGLDSDPQPLPLRSSAPGIFTADQSGRGQGAILLAGTGRLADAANPAAGGQFLEMYLTGLPEGAPPAVTIGGVAAEVTFAGAAPGFAGLQQVNVRVPAGVAPGNAVPVRLTHSGFTSNEVTIAVR